MFSDVYLLLLCIYVCINRQQETRPTMQTNYVKNILRLHFHYKFVGGKLYGK